MIENLIHILLLILLILQIIVLMHLFYTNYKSHKMSEQLYKELAEERSRLETHLTSMYLEEIEDGQTSDKK